MIKLNGKGDIQWITRLPDRDIVPIWLTYVYYIQILMIIETGFF